MARLKNRLFLVTHPSGFFGSLDFGWRSVDVGLLVSDLSKEFEVNVVSITEIRNVDLTVDDVVLYSSSNDSAIRQFYKDVLFTIESNCRLLPRYELLMAHENKGFQELIKVDNGIDGLAGKYLFDLDDLDRPMPFVFKTTGGAGSSGVALVESEKDLKLVWKRHFRPTLSRRIITFIRTLRMGRADRAMYGYRHKGFYPFVAQDFIPGLEGDFKVLVFGDRFFVLKRSVRPGDFRASGSGLFQFHTDPDVAVLDFARRVFEKLDSPYLSLDVAKDSSGECKLIEFQAIHFGPYTLLRSPGFFSHDRGQWHFVAGKARLESEMARSISRFMLKDYCAQAPL